MNNAEATEDYLISKDKQLLQLDKILDMLAKTYWAQNRQKETVIKSIDNSICYGLYSQNVQVGFARIITDYATTYYICDVVVDESCRGQGLGKKLVDAIVHDEELTALFGILATRDAHGLYEQYGFVKGGDRFMSRK